MINLSDIIRKIETLHKQVLGEGDDIGGAIDSVVMAAGRLPDKSELKDRLATLLSGANPGERLKSGFEEDIDYLTASVMDLSNLLNELKDKYPDYKNEDWIEFIEQW